MLRRYPRLMTRSNRRGIAEQDAQLSIDRKGSVHLTHRAKELLVNREIPAAMLGRRLLPGLPQLCTNEGLDVR